MQIKYRPEQLVSYIEEGMGITIPRKPNAVTLINLLGSTPVGSYKLELNKNEPDLYNDCLIAIIRVFRGFEAYAVKVTGEPGKKYTKDIPHPQGVAHLIECSPMKFKWGTHKGRQALVPATADVVWRDENKNHVLDPAEKLFRGNFQLRIHSGGTKESIGGWSAGCIAVHGGEAGKPWEKLLEILNKHPLKYFDVFVSRGYAFYRWTEDNEYQIPIHIGSQGIQVMNMQKFLNINFESGLRIDGDFGTKTLNAYLSAQKKKKIKRLSAYFTEAQKQRLRGAEGPQEDEGGFYAFID